MNHPYHSGSPNDATFKEAAKVNALINELDRRVRLLESDIAREEGLSGASDPFSTAYPLQARMMMARRDNLKQTIAALAKRLPAEAMVTG